MTKILIAGDWHGNTNHARKVVRMAASNGIKIVMQVGDFGFWTHEVDGFNYLDALNDECRKHGVKVYFVAGNHENWDRLDWMEKNNPKTYAGLIVIRSHIRYTGRVKRWSLDGKWFQAVGGAVSIDKAHRTLGKSWWVQEMVPENVVKGLENWNRQSDYLLTHDAPTCAPFRFRLKNDPDSQMHRELMNRIGRVVKPKLWFHGHYHTWMENYSFMHQAGYTSVYGLDMDGEFYHCVILNTEDDSVEIPMAGRTNVLD